MAKRLARRCSWCGKPAGFMIGVGVEPNPPVEPEGITIRACDAHMDDACEEGLRLLIALRAGFRGDTKTAEEMARRRIAGVGITMVEDP